MNFKLDEQKKLSGYDFVIIAYKHIYVLEEATCYLNIFNCNVGLLITKSLFHFDPFTITPSKKERSKQDSTFACWKRTLFSGLTVLPNVLVRLSFGMINHQDQKQHAEKQVYFTLQV